MPDGSAYVRTTKYVLPFVSLVPGSPGSAGGDVDGVIFIVSPVDDTHHVLFFGFWSVNARDQRRALPRRATGAAVDRR